MELSNCSAVLIRLFPPTIHFTFGTWGDDIRIPMHGKRHCSGTLHNSQRATATRLRDCGVYITKVCKHPFQGSGYVPYSLVLRPHPKIGKGPGHTCQKFLYVLSKQQSSFGIDGAHLSITNFLNSEVVDSFQDHVHITSRNPEPLIMYGLSIGHMVVLIPRNAMLKAIGTQPFIIWVHN